jgi:hypothetical protein
MIAERDLPATRTSVYRKSLPKRPMQLLQR